MALRNNFKDLATRTAVYAFIAVVLGLVTTSSFAAPVTEIDNILDNPCGRINKLRHSRQAHTIYHEITLQINVSTDYYQKTTLYQMKELYRHIKPRKLDYRLNWLPKVKEIKRLNLNNSKTLLPKLLQQSKTYLLTFYRLLKANIKTPDGTFNVEKRSSILNKTIHNLKLIACEVEEAANECDISLPINSKNSNNKIKLPGSMDVTTAYYTDFAIMRRYGIFLKNWKKKIVNTKPKSKKKGATKRQSGKKTAIKPNI